MTLNSVPMVRSLLKFLVPFFAFFDDYWYYIYHDNEFYQLETIPAFLVIMYKVNSERVMPDIFDSEKIQNSYDIRPYFKSSFRNFTNIQIEKINDQ